MSLHFVTDARLDTRIDLHRDGCHCPRHQRRLFTGLLGAGALVGGTPAWAREGVDVGGRSQFSKLVSAEQIEQAASEQYVQLTQEARQKKALAPVSHPQQIRLQAIADRLIPYTYEWNPRARQWKWEVVLLGEQTVNAFCMPGGKIAFYWGILQQLQLSDDEVAMIMGHEMAHALREHARERLGKQTATRGAIELGAMLLGLGELGRTAAGLGGQLLTLKFGREDESEADLVGLELAARAGYDPESGVTLWQKMQAASKGAPPQFLSTHPSSGTRISDIQANIPKVAGLYERAQKPARRFGPPAAKAS
ncbi:peptidase M48-like protein [Sphaerotilus hippei]|uniref:Peptidase M48-like protein n=1 Tax=Sphaerotilus hippei TaxID=744406 RepID=A0A318GWK3_9BURK|nr:M48 family metallopeptidase [Sphaerotilus hippei]PXW93899.1 peptidase M48-like protein [Sphaerotilus hippei]